MIGIIQGLAGGMKILGARNIPHDRWLSRDEISRIFFWAGSFDRGILCASVTGLSGRSGHEEAT